MKDKLDNFMTATLWEIGVFTAVWIVFAAVWIVLMLVARGIAILWLGY